MSTRDEGPRLLTCKQAAAYCNVGRDGFNLHFRPRLAAFRVGRRILFDRRALDLYLDALSGIAGKTPASVERDLARERITARLDAMRRKGA